MTAVSSTPAPAADPAGSVLDAVAGRRSVRSYLGRPVPHATLLVLLAAASRAPSGNNTQPWRVHVLTGAGRQRLTDAIMAVRAAGGDDPAPEYPYYPEHWVEPFAAQRRANGWELYGLLGIKRGDRAGSRAWQDGNFRFFGAPVGLILTRDRRLGLGSFIDLGMFMEALAVAARAFGLATCPQVAFVHYHATVRDVLGLAPEDMVVCGMSLGVADEAAPANTLRTGREPVSAFATFHAGETPAAHGASPHG